MAASVVPRCGMMLTLFSLAAEAFLCSGTAISRAAGVGSRQLVSGLSPGSLRLRGAGTGTGTIMAAGSPNTISALPGTLDKEDQTPCNPLDASSRVLVVGASRGIGLEFCKQLLSRGCSVVATVRKSPPPEDIASLQAEVGTRLDVLVMDVGQESSVAAAAARLKGSPPLTHIIHNAGIYGPTISLDGKARLNRPAARAVTKADMLSVFEINAVGPLLVAQHFVPLFKTPSSLKDTGVMAILSSKVGSMDDNGSGGAYAYRASKSACNIVAKSLFNDLRGTAAVFLLHPGYVRTDMTNGNGLIDADESVRGMLAAVEATDGESPFRWVDYKACLIPW